MDRGSRGRAGRTGPYDRPSSSGSGAGAGKWQHDLFEDDPMGIGSYAPRVARVFGDRPASAPSSSGTARGRGMAAYSASTSQAAAPPPPPAAQGESSNLFARVGFQGVESRVTAAQERRQAEDARREQERQERLAREETARKRREEQRRADEEKRKRLESERKRKEVEDRWVEELALWKVENSSNAVPVEVHGLMNGTSEEDVKTAFGPYGTILSVVIKDPKVDILTARIVFHSEAEAVDAVEKLDGAVADGNELTVRIMPKMARPARPDFGTISISRETQAAANNVLNTSAKAPTKADLIPKPPAQKTMRADWIEEYDKNSYKAPSEHQRPRMIWEEEIVPPTQDSAQDSDGDMAMDMDAAGGGSGGGDTSGARKSKRSGGGGKRKGASKSVVTGSVRGAALMDRIAGAAPPPPSSRGNSSAGPAPRGTAGGLLSRIK